MRESHISLAHGNGGRLMRELIEELLARHLGNPILDVQSDAATLPLPASGELLFSTDGFTVQPLEFPGGSIGSLAVHGTVNDLAVAGADPLYLSLALLIEEGMEVALLDRIIADLATAAQECGVQIATGDTKVVRRGEGGGLYITTAGIGLRRKGMGLGMAQIKPNDQIVISGPVGDHGAAVMLAREQFGLRGTLRSDCAPVLPLTQAIREIPGVRFMRDPTRGGLATVCHEIVRATGLGILLESTAIPIHGEVGAVCEILGYDPLYLACEGRVVAVVAEEATERVLQAWRTLPQGGQAARIGRLTTELTLVAMTTELGGERILQELEEDPLPRIC